jgi:hypothetical protein
VSVACRCVGAGRSNEELLRTKPRGFSFYSYVTLFPSLTASVVWWSEFLATDPEVRVRSPALTNFRRSSGSGTGSTQPREYNLGATW